MNATSWKSIAAKCLIRLGISVDAKHFLFRTCFACVAMASNAQPDSPKLWYEASPIANGIPKNYAAVFDRARPFHGESFTAESVPARSTFRPLITAIVFTKPSNAPEQREYLPLNEDYEWTMNARIVSVTGTTLNAMAHRKVERRVVRDGKSYFQMHTWVENKVLPVDYTLLCRKDRFGFYTITEGETRDEEQLELILPLKVGQSWQRLVGKYPVKDAVISVETVTVEGRRYTDCFHIRSATPDGSFTEDSWEAPDVGCVKSEMAFGNGARITLTLTDFTPGK